MAKKKKAKKVVNVPEGMKCYQKQGGGSYRTNNRIIKPKQKFFMFPESVPEAFKNSIKEVAPDSKAIVINAPRPRIEGKKEVASVPEKFEMIKALDENGEVIKKGDSALYNVVGEDKQALNEKPLRKGKAKELLETLEA